MNCGTFIPGTSLWNKNKWTIDTWNNADEPQMQYAEWKEPDSKAAYHESIYVTLLNRQKSRDMKWISVYQRWGIKEQYDQKGAWRNLARGEGGNSPIFKCIVCWKFDNCLQSGNHDIKMYNISLTLKYFLVPCCTWTGPIDLFSFYPGHRQNHICFLFLQFYTF